MKFVNKFKGNRFVVAIFASIGLAAASPAMAQFVADDGTALARGGTVDPRSPWGDPTAVITSTGQNSATLQLTNMGMTSYDAIPGITGVPDARFRDRTAYNVAFLGDRGYPHPSLANTRYCITAVGDRNYGRYVCAETASSMSIAFTLEPGATAVLVPFVIGADGRTVGYGWQPNNAPAFDGWRAMVVTNRGGTIRMATPAEALAFQNGSSYRTLMTRVRSGDSIAAVGN